MTSHADTHLRLWNWCSFASHLRQRRQRRQRRRQQHQRQAHIRAPIKTYSMSTLPTLSAMKAGIPLTFQWPVKFCFYTSLITYVLSIITGNVSQVDRLWTFLPVIYTAYYAFLPWWPFESPVPLYPYSPKELDRTLLNEGNPRTQLMLVLQLIWMARLSYNTWRRGLFSL